MVKASTWEIMALDQVGKKTDQWTQTWLSTKEFSVPIELKVWMQTTYPCSKEDVSKLLIKAIITWYIKLALPRSRSILSALVKTSIITRKSIRMRKVIWEVPELLRKFRNIIIQTAQLPKALRHKEAEAAQFKPNHRPIIINSKQQAVAFSK